MITWPSLCLMEVLSIKFSLAHHLCLLVFSVPISGFSASYCLLNGVEKVSALFLSVHFSHWNAHGLTSDASRLSSASY